VRPIIHVSIPVSDLQESVDFYVGELGAEVGRRMGSATDILVFGAQLTLHQDPEHVSCPMPRTRHFGATLAWAEWEQMAQRFTGSELVVEGPEVSYAGEPTEQGKFMLADPSGNLVEIKAYRSPQHVLGTLTATEGVASSSDP
jgi:extradiol dioxygenase family protein